jgi:hypothetical protein
MKKIEAAIDPATLDAVKLHLADIMSVSMTPVFALSSDALTAQRRRALPTSGTYGSAVKILEEQS